ncbi:MAG: RNA polymerase sigma factor [Phycisphaerales bacterium]
MSEHRGEGPPDAAELLARMREGDREAASRFVSEFGEVIRRRVRGKLGRGMRRLFDSQEILSTLSRRLDRYVRDGQVRAGDTPQLWGLVFKMVDAALVDKARVYARLRGIEGEDSEFARSALRRFSEKEHQGDEGVELEIDSAFRCLRSDVDRELLAMWLNDVPFRQIAALLNTTPEAARQRWQSIRAHLRRAWLEEDKA